MRRPIYLDHAATTPVDKKVADKMWQYLTLDGQFGNAASTTHVYGDEARLAVDDARAQVAQFIHAQVEEIIFTSGATEANNLAIKGAAFFNQHKGKHIVTLKTEHKAVLDPCLALAEQGFQVTFLDVQKNGKLDLVHFESALQDNTLLVSIAHVNNELGVIQDLKEIGAITRKRGILFHVDAAQSAGRLPIHVEEMNIDLLSLSAHKMYGPKGVGALYVRRKPRVRLQALMQGGAQEQGLRPGTLAVHQIVGMGEAVRIATAEMNHESERITLLRTQLWQALQTLPGIYLNTDLVHSAPHFLNISFKNVDGETLISMMPKIAVSMGSACMSAEPSPSHVLKAIGVAPQLIHNTLRISLGRYTTPEDIAIAAEQISTCVLQLST